MKRTNEYNSGSRPRQPRSNDAGYKRRGSSASPSTKSKFDYADAEERAYLVQREEMLRPKHIAFEPKEMSREDLQATGPGVVSGEYGMREMLGQRLALAQKVMRKEVVQWTSREQRADVLALVERLEASTHEEDEVAGRDGEADDVSAKSSSGNNGAATDAPTDEVGQVMQKLFGGSYAMARPRGAGDVLGHVARQAGMNDSYYPDDEDSLLKKVKGLVAGRPVGGKGAR